MNFIISKCLLFSFLFVFSVNFSFAENYGQFGFAANFGNNPNSFNNLSSNPQISAEKSRYRVGEIIVNGAGFDRFEQVSIIVLQLRVTEANPDIVSSWNVYADKNGEFVTNFLLPFDGNFSFKAIGNNSTKDTPPVSIASVTPIVISGNPTCANLNASSDPAFAHITSNWGFKDDSPAAGTFTFTNGSGWSLTGGAPADATKTVTISNLTSTTFSWTSTKLITAVIVKGGSNANVYPYNPASFGDTLLSAISPHAISHFEFCISPGVVTSAAASVAGRISRNDGQGIGKVMVTIQNIASGEVQSVLTGSMGYYRFEEIPVGSQYIISVSHKQYVFSPESQLITLNEAAENIDFVGNAR